MNMKKIYTYITMIALAALAAGCAKEKDTLQDEVLSPEALAQLGEETTVTVVLSVPESADTKTTLGAKDGSSYPVYWSLPSMVLRQANSLLQAEMPRRPPNSK